MKRIIAAVLVTAMAAAVCVAAAGCGKKSASASSSATIATQSTTAPTTKSTQPTTRAFTGGATNGATTSPTDSTSTTDPSGATLPHSTSTVEGAALEYFGLSSGSGATTVINSTQNAPDGTPFALVYVMYSGNVYPLFVATDGSVAYEPETYFEVYGMSAQDYTQSPTSGDDYDGYDYDEYNYVDPYDYYDPDDYYYGYGYGPDGAEP